MAKTNMGSVSLASGYSVVKCKFNEQLGEGKNPQGSNGVPVHIYKTSSQESIAMATSATKVDIPA